MQIKRILLWKDFRVQSLFIFSDPDGLVEGKKSNYYHAYIFGWKIKLYRNLNESTCESSIRVLKLLE